MFSITIPTISSNGDFVEFDLYELLTALQARALEARWLCSGVECLGAGADELMEYAAFRAPISGTNLYQLSLTIDQILAGVFEAFEVDENKPWLKIRVVHDKKIEFFSLNRNVLNRVARLYPQAAQVRSQ
ncbi:MAG: hypothetical protein JXA25_13485 [Anaerolineales bacterium]|nr:hypothetical protein [Anaerolineales bacterium]